MKRLTDETENGRFKAYIGIGSNLALPREQVTRACSALADLADCGQILCSSLYRSLPMGPRDQPDYINAAAGLVTAMEPLSLLHALQAIERVQGRVRGVRWGARTLDLDLLVYGNLMLHTAELQIPHPGIAQRAFVLFPLFDIAPDLLIPGLGSLAELVHGSDAAGLVRIGEMA